MLCCITAEIKTSVGRINAGEIDLSTQNAEECARPSSALLRELSVSLSPLAQVGEAELIPAPCMPAALPSSAWPIWLVSSQPPEMLILSSLWRWLQLCCVPARFSEDSGFVFPSCFIPLCFIMAIHPPGVASISHLSTIPHLSPSAEITPRSAAGPGLLVQRYWCCWCNGTGAIGKMGLGLLVQRDWSCWSRGTGAVTALGDAAPHQRASNYIPHRWDAKSTSSPPAHAGEKEMKCGGSFGCVLRTDPLSSGKRAGRAVWGLWGGTGRVGVSQWGAGQPGAEPGLLAPLQARLLGHGAGILLSLLDCYFLLIRLQMRCFG